MKKNNLLTGALILSVGGFLAKVFSAVYRIVITRILGGEGIGLYQLIFPFYSLCVVFATAGLPMAVSKVVSKHINNKNSVLKKCLFCSSVLSLILTLVFVVSAKGLALLQGDVRLSVCYIILAPTIILVGASSVLKGYFQGSHNFYPSALSNIGEQFAKMVVGLVLSLLLVKISLFASVVGAIIAIVVSEIVSLLLLMFQLKKNREKQNKISVVTVRELVKDIFPITLTNIILPISTFIDSILVVNLLGKNFSNSMSVFLYGLESGAVSSLVSIPTIFSFAIASVILPNIVNLKHNFNKNLKINIATKIILIITIPCVVCFSLIPKRLICFLYNDKLNAFGVDGTLIASKLLVISGVGVVFLAINQIYSSVLQAVDERYVTIRNLLIGVVLKFVVEILFMPSKILNIYALAISNVVCYLTPMLLNYLELRRIFSLKLNFWFWAKLIFSNVVMVVALICIMSIKMTSANTLLAIIVAGLIYLFCLFKTGIFGAKEKAMLKYKV